MRSTFKCHYNVFQFLYFINVHPVNFRIDAFVFHAIQYLNDNI